MTAGRDFAQSKHRFAPAEVAISLGLFLLALLPRAYGLQRFVTADEAKWVYRSAQFLAALLKGDFAATSVNLTPAVTTTWLGSLGLTLYYRFHRATINAPFTDWLLSLPEFRVEMPLLIATRWPVVVFTSLGVVAIYLLARRLFGDSLAFIGAAFIALDPHTIALSRILGHDAPVTIFMVISLLLLLSAVKTGEGASLSRNGNENENLESKTIVLDKMLLASGVAAGLAFLSKAPGLFLIPFAALVLMGQAIGKSTHLYFWFKKFALWAIVAYLTFVAVWPAAWVDPLGRPQAVVENAFLSATDQDEADSEGYWLVPDPGPFYYLVNGAFKLSPLVLVGAGLLIIPIFTNQQSFRSTLGRTKNDTLANEPTRLTSHVSRLTSHASRFTYHLAAIAWLALFVLLFTIFMTLGDKRSPRYILPAFPPLALLAAFGWLWLYRVAGSRVAGDNSKTQEMTPTPAKSQIPNSKSQIPQYGFSILLTICALIILLPYAPYYFTYYNPLVGGAYTAPQWVKIGWGEGLDQVGRFLQRELRHSRVGTAYASTVAPFFQGDISGVTGSSLDYVVLYTKQVQSGEPSPTFIRYFEQLGPLFSVELNGIHYADLYPGPALQPALALTPGLDAAILPKPIGFRPHRPYGAIGRPLGVDVVWLADNPLPGDPSIVTLRPLSVFDSFDISHEGHEHGPLEEAPAGAPEILAQGEGYLTRRADNLVVSTHLLNLPDDLERGVYALLVDGRPLGEVEVRRFDAPDNLGRVKDVVFGEQIGLVGYHFQPADDNIEGTIAWQAQKPHLPDYTVFAQFLDAETNARLAGVDTRPVNGQWPTSRWVKDEVVVDRYQINLPPDVGPGFYKVIVGLYQPQTGQRLIRANGQDHWTLPFTVIRDE